jgi:FkbM family methyltransferase
MRLPRVHNEYLLRRLAARLGVALVCDVGSFDGTHAKRFRQAGLRVIAFEANPHCYAALAADRSIESAGIRVVNAAAWNKDETVRFHVVTSAEKWRGSPRTSIGSVLERVPGFNLETYASVAVPAVRLDSALAAETGPIALWIDVEGAGHEVVEGIAGIRERVAMINIEIETQAFWQRQRLGADVVGSLRDLGFTPIARGPGGDLQFDLVFVNDRWLRAAPFTIRSCTVEAFCRLAASAVRARVRRALSGARA